MSALSSRFTSSTTPTSGSSLRNRPTGEQQEDELCTLDIEAALFPSSPSPSSPSSGARDPFSPSAFKNLHMNAVGLLTRMQAAYRSQATALRDLQAERAAERDELEEAVTRAAHLKMQLEDMSRKAAEREAAVRELAGELERERKARSRAEAELTAAAVQSKMSEGEGTPSMVSEDLGVEEDRRRRRRRRLKRNSGGERGEEEEEEEGSSTTDDEIDSAESESVFSRCRSPPLTLQSPLQTQAPPMGALDGASAPRVAATGGFGTPGSKNAGGSGSLNSTPKQRTGQPMGAFQKILRGFSGDAAGCSNCKGQDASVAWDTVSLLRDENRHLKNRIGELEHAVEGALDLVNGVGLKVPPLS
ncbi:hypothetical protein VTH82DRAFT_1145 [Thermothelomyces myriococcoides]